MEHCSLICMIRKTYGVSPSFEMFPLEFRSEQDPATPEHVMELFQRAKDWVASNNAEANGESEFSIMQVVVADHRQISRWNLQCKYSGFEESVEKTIRAAFEVVKPRALG